MMSNVDQENGRVQESVMTKEVFKKTFWRTFPLQACFVMSVCRMLASLIRWCRL